MYNYSWQCFTMWYITSSLLFGLSAVSFCRHSSSLSLYLLTMLNHADSFASIFHTSDFGEYLFDLLWAMNRSPCCRRRETASLRRTTCWRTEPVSWTRSTTPARRRGRSTASCSSSWSRCRRRTSGGRKNKTFSFHLWLKARVSAFIGVKGGDSTALWHCGWRDYLCLTVKS